MANVLIRNLPDEVHRALRARAARNGRSTEAEIRAILAENVLGPGRLQIGAELRRFGDGLGGVDLDVRRDAGAVEPATFD